MALDYANERYVLLYTRDTTTWKLLDWEARAVLMFLLRKVDRAGVLDVGADGVDGLAAVLEVPVDVVARAMPKLVAKQTVASTGTAFVLPNFLEAQETPRSDKQRQRDSRDRRRSVALSRNVTDESRNVTVSHETGPSVTRGHTASQPVTPDQTSPIRSDPDSLSLPAREAVRPITPAAKPYAPVARLVTLAVELLNAARRELDPTSQPIAADQGDEMALAGHLRDVPEDQREAAVRHGVAVIAESVRVGKEQVTALRPGELLGPKSWRKWQAATVASVRKSAAPAPSRFDRPQSSSMPAVGKGPAPVIVSAADRAEAAAQLAEAKRAIGLVVTATARGANP